jgi:hypothetical protein
MANEFRCYALSRIEFLKSQKTHAIFGLWAFLLGDTMRGSEESKEKTHFENEAKICQFY